MPFSLQQGRVPTSIGHITVYLRDPNGAVGSRSLDGRIEIKDATGAVMHKWEGNLANYLSASVLTQLNSFMSALRTQAEEELLP
jgi:hypothetical protein